MDYTKLQQHFFLLLLLGIVILAFLIFKPFIAPVVIAGTFAIIFQPLYRLLLHVLPRETIAALLTTLCILLLIFVPLMLFGVHIFNEARILYLKIDEGTLPDTLSTIVQDRIQSIFPDLTLDLRAYTRQLLSWLVQNSGAAFSSASQFILGAFLTMLALYYFLKDGRRLRRGIISLSPLLDAHDARIFDRLHLAIISVVQGSLVIALLQGLATTAGFLIFGIPHAILWGSLAVIAALIPQVGTALILVPGIAYLFLTGHPTGSIGLIVWGLTAVGLIDNLLGPKLIERGLRIHPFLILLAVLGGLAFFGPVGFLLGPLVLSLLFALLDIYRILILPTSTIIPPDKVTEVP